MIKIILEILFVFLALVGSAYFLYFCHFSNCAQILNSEQSAAVSINGKNFFVETAKSKKQIETGLMDRKELAEDRGMLFVFEKEGIYPFWMKNTLISLDIIWIKDNKIVFIAESAQPCRAILCSDIVPSEKANYVLEINGGLCKKLGFAVGNEVVIKFDTKD